MLRYEYLISLDDDLAIRHIIGWCGWKCCVYVDGRIDAHRATGSWAGVHIAMICAG